MTDVPAVDPPDPALPIISRNVQLIDADGVDLLDLRYAEATVFALGGGVVGMAGMPAIRSTVDTIPLQPGGRFQDIQHGTRTLGLNIGISGTVPADVETLVDTLVGLIDPVRGDMRIRVRRHDGGWRECNCRYTGGFQVTELTNSDVVWTSSLAFTAVDPYWYTEQQSISFGIASNSSPKNFFDATSFFPVDLGISGIEGNATIVNDGHADAWPVWSITGPGTDVIIQNLTTGEYLKIDGDVGGAHTVTIDTRPGRKTVRSDNGTNLFGQLDTASDPPSQLFPLVPGPNDIQVTVTGATSATLITATWRDPYLTT